MEDDTFFRSHRAGFKRGGGPQRGNFCLMDGRTDGLTDRAMHGFLNVFEIYASRAG